VSYALRRLGPDDRFGIVAFNSDVNPFADRLSRTSDTDDALYFVDQLEARGGTNINEALATGLGFLDDKRKGMVVFLTDGLPSTGVVNINEIRTNAERNNRFHARIFSFGVGYDVNTNLLDGLSRSSAAFADYIVPEENIEERVSAFYERVRFPVMTDVEISFRGVRVSEISPRDPGDLFLGDALILTGRYRNEGTGVISISGSIDGQRTTQEVDVAFPAVDRESAFVARVWATRRIGELLESVRLEGESEALVDEIVELAKEFGIVTPYTSYLVTEDEARFLSAGEFDRVSADNNAMPRAQREALAAMPQSSGRAAIEMSKRISNFKQASVVESTDGIPVTNVLGQTLIESAGGIWESQADVAGLKVWRVKFGSEAYFDFAESYPEAKDFLKLGEKVNFVFRNQVVVVGESGQSEIDREGLTRLFGE
jgi:Ca-activated chloride channel family protein